MQSFVSCHGKSQDLGFRLLTSRIAPRRGAVLDGSKVERHGHDAIAERDLPKIANAPIS